MLDKKLLNIYQNIVNQSIQDVYKHVDKNDLTGEINFATIFTKTKSEYDSFSKNLAQNGSIFDQQITGTYFKLFTPISTNGKSITICRVYKPSNSPPLIGYCDFNVYNYPKFKQKYKNKENFTIMQNQHGIELIELHHPGSTVNIYFPDVWD